MDEIVNAVELARITARRLSTAEQLVRDQVLAETLRDLPPPSVRQRLEASHYNLVTSASPLAIARALRV